MSSNENEFNKPFEQDIRPTGTSDPSVGSSHTVSKSDHKHQLATPDVIVYTPNARSNNNATNITSYGRFWIDQHLWVELEVAVLFTGAPTAGGFFEVTLPYAAQIPNIALASFTSAGFIIGQGWLTDLSATQAYVFDAVVDPATPTRMLLSTRVSPVTFVAAAVPVALAVNDVMSILCRYRKDPKS